MPHLILLKIEVKDLLSELRKQEQPEHPICVYVGSASGLLDHSMGYN